ncbi:hypothetical protein A3B05_00170 [Candidatus Giovannonibacteria bacterium RIFCSPLOWO2_01_FULL_43_160]|uniref:Type 4 fimbrial biogenesis protein PilX N-terminal domain-containing protein n=2 Tax=Candidatus Giovannoniibacteriota TaxID=1752738 RepID=A0A0G1L5C9_9BACT|nr:MAG: hypothetical protein UV72_C0001G0040 [Candidatus Giovannonibacteria bacterium GW2011_GWB1_43_13]KKS99757.1 MAG: hypothetical protein UV75_C0002G0138 [Candidatus Giovannonibacteria bacterium GW2011_GWA1_43_15]KKT21172.1 MAG: hypothetical protein UW05_C0016G0015 [Candidatus Giovannonibacteria bacterium GW2011_GWC2_43_8]KKT63842.1 MAG: hypothetical protein UW55_C0001G0135 [Candidatus Giovannonibacteria bacterium GW2011_GWA2_44_26]OGF58166.1 MAG: hypothetical protein A2652_02540 [Candidatus
MKLKTQNQEQVRQKTGQAALIAVMLMLIIMLSAIFGASSVALKEAKVAEENKKSKLSFFAAEAGLEDAVYRLKRGKIVSSSFSILLNGATSNTTVTSAGGRRDVYSEGDLAGNVRALNAALLNSDGVSFYYGVQVGDGGLEMSNNSTINGNVFSNGSIVGSNGTIITGDAIVAGGINTNPSLEWAIQNSDNFFATATGNRDITQSFIANATNKLNKVAVYLGKVGNPTSNITLRINTDNGNKPSTTSIASATIQYTSVGLTPGWIGVALPSPPNITNGTKYWIVLDYGSNSASNYWNWRKDSSDNYLNNTGKYTSNCCSGNPVWTNVGGDLAFQAWIGGVNTKIDGLTIGNASSGTGRANLFVNTTIHGSACPNQYCIVENPAREEMPISAGLIQDWKDAAATGGICVQPQCDALGNLFLSNGASANLGPIKINGNLTLSNNATLTVTGVIWVAGNINVSNNCNVRLSPSYGSLSGMIVTDGTVRVSNNCVFSGSGTTGSYIMLLSAKNAPTSDVIEVNNNATGVIYYASNGRIEFENNAAAKEAVAYGIDMENGATITYETGLANINFSSGPSGGWDINSWQETLPQ